MGRLPRVCPGSARVSGEGSPPASLEVLRHGPPEVDTQSDSYAACIVISRHTHMLKT